MGSATSKNLHEAEVSQLSFDTGFSNKQIQRLYNRFCALDKDDTGHLSRQTLLMIPELAINPLGDRIVNEFFRNSGEELNFRDFVNKLAIFRKQETNREMKLFFLFGLYDLDGDNYISQNELLGMLQMMVGANITQEQMNNIGERTMVEADLDGDGLISYDEFKRAFVNIDIDQKMSIKFLE